jgi:biopolymer transport protein ExbB
VVVSTIITAEPMLGILGTVTGIIQTFSALHGNDGVTNPLSATGGIGEALITTAAGLIASLILLFPYNVISEKCDD